MAILPCRSTTTGSACCGSCGDPVADILVFKAQEWHGRRRPRINEVMARVAVLLVALGGLGLGACAGSRGRAEHDVVFTRYSPLSRNAEVARRVLPPITYRRIQQALAARKHELAEQTIELASEKFDIYIPGIPGDPPPPGGYGLLVFIAPWSEPTRPQRWRAALDRHGLIFVSAQRSGNDTSLIDRRLPLALLAYENVRARFPIDARRVYVTGFSGGSRVAQVAALAYPDVFRGAILNAGADPIDGQDGIYKPPVELFRAFQHARLVYITGDQDVDNLRQDDVSQASMRAACVLDIKTETAFRIGHQSLDGFALGRALDALEEPRQVDAAELARCNARVERALADKLAEAAAAITRGDRDRARRLIQAIDARFGGLAAPAILDLDARLAALP
jgi:pimeloyl-ACP methyl ester carboxylesterase